MHLQNARPCFRYSTDFGSFECADVNSSMAANASQNYDAPVLLRVASTNAESTYDQPNPNSLSIFIGAGSKNQNQQACKDSSIDYADSPRLGIPQTPSVYDNLPAVEGSLSNYAKCQLSFVSAQLNSDSDYCEILENPQGNSENFEEIQDIQERSSPNRQVSKSDAKYVNYCSPRISRDHRSIPDRIEVDQPTSRPEIDRSNQPSPVYNNVSSTDTLNEGRTDGAPSALFRSSFHASFPSRDLRRTAISPAPLDSDQLTRVINIEGQSASTYQTPIIRRTQVRLSSGHMESRFADCDHPDRSIHTDRYKPALPQSPPPVGKPEMKKGENEGAEPRGQLNEPIMRRGQTGQRSSHDSAYHSSSAHSSCSDEVIVGSTIACNDVIDTSSIGSHDVNSSSSFGSSELRPLSSVSSSGRSSYCSNDTRGSSISCGSGSADIYHTPTPSTRVSTKTLTCTPDQPDEPAPNETENHEENCQTSENATYMSIYDGFSDQNASKSLKGDISSKNDISSKSDISSNNNIPFPHDHALSRDRKQQLLHRSHITYLDRVVIELLDTERAFVNDMHEIFRGYQSLFANSLCGPGGIPVAFVNELFQNIALVLSFNREFYISLDRCELDYVRIAETFVKHADGFSVYSTYCTSYPRIISLLDHFETKEQISEQIAQRQAELNHALPLGSYLLKPVQRILKYHLFLQNMLKHCSVVNADLSDPKQCRNLQAVDMALQQMTAIAREINEAKKRSELSMKVDEVNRMLAESPDDVTQAIDVKNLGSLVREARFRLFGAKPAGFRQLYLFQTALLLAKEKAENTWAFKTAIPCADLMIKETVNCDPLCFQVWHINKPKCLYTLQASSTEERREWTQEMKGLMLECSRLDIPAHARELLMNIQPDGTTPQTSNGGVATRNGNARKALNTAKYLEKRRKSVDANVDKLVKKQQSEQRNSKHWKKYSRSQSSDHLGIKAGTHEVWTPGAKKKAKDGNSSKLEGFFASRKTSSTSRISPFQRLLDSTSGSQLISSRSNRNRRSCGESDMYAIKKKETEVPLRSLDAEMVPNYSERMRSMSKSLDAETFLRSSNRLSMNSASASETAQDQSIDIDRRFLIDRVTGSQVTLGDQSASSSTLRLSPAPGAGSRNQNTPPEYYQQRRSQNTNLSPCGRKFVKKQAVGHTKSLSFDQHDESFTSDVNEPLENPYESELAYEAIWEEMKRFIEEGGRMQESERVELRSSGRRAAASTSARFPVPKKDCVQVDNLYCTCDHTDHDPRLMDRSIDNQSADHVESDKQGPDRVQSAMDRLSSLIGHSSSHRGDSIRSAKIELFSALERTRPARPATAPNLKRPRSLGNLSVNQPSAEGIYECLVEKNLDEVDSAIFSDEDFDWLLTAGVRYKSATSTRLPSSHEPGFNREPSGSHPESGVERGPAILPTIIKRFGDLEPPSASPPPSSDPDLRGIQPVSERIKRFQTSKAALSGATQCKDIVGDIM